MSRKRSVDLSKLAIGKTAGRLSRGDKRKILQFLMES